MINFSDNNNFLNQNPLNTGNVFELDPRLIGGDYPMVTPRGVNIDYNLNLDSVRKLNIPYLNFDQERPEFEDDLPEETGEDFFVDPQYKLNPNQLRNNSVQKNEQILKNRGTADERLQEIARRSAMFRAGVSIPSGSYALGESLAYSGDSKVANTFKGVGAAGKLLFGVGRNMLSGYASQKRNQSVMTDYYKRLAETMKGDYSTENVKDPYFDYGYYFKDGGQIPMSGRMLSGDFLFENPHGVHNVEVEDKEYIKNPDGTIQKVVGKRHEDGGVKVQLEQGTKVLSDNVKVEERKEELSEIFKLKIKKTDTPATVIDKISDKIGFTAVQKEQTTTLDKLEKQKEVKDEVTKNINSLFLQTKSNQLELIKQAIGKKRKVAFDKMFQVQEEIKGNEVEKIEVLPTFKDGGVVDPSLEAMSKVLTNRNSSLNWVKRVVEGSDLQIDNENGSSSTHELAYSTGDRGEAYVYPTIIEREGKLVRLNPKEAQEYAFSTNTAMEVPNVQLAEYYSKNGLIKHENGGMVKNPKFKALCEKYGLTIEQGMTILEKNSGSKFLANNNIMSDGGTVELLNSVSNEDIQIALNLVSGVGVGTYSNLSKTVLNIVSSLKKEPSMILYAESLLTGRAQQPPSTSNNNNSTASNNNNNTNRVGFSNALSNPNLPNIQGTQHEDSEGIFGGVDKNKAIEWYISNMPEIANKFFRKTESGYDFKEGISADEFQNEYNNYLNDTASFFKDYADKTFTDETQKEDYLSDLNSYIENQKFIVGSTARDIDDKFGRFTSTRGAFELAVVTPTELELLNKSGINTFSQAVDPNNKKLVSEIVGEEKLNNFREGKEDHGLVDFKLAAIEDMSGDANTSNTGEGEVDTNSEFKKLELMNRLKKMGYPILPDQSFIPPSGLQPHLLESISLDRLDPIKVAHEPFVRASVENLEYLEDQISGLPPSQQAAILANAQATNTKAINDQLTRVELSNAQNAMQTDQFNASQDFQEDSINMTQRLGYEQRQYTAQSKLEANINNFYEANRRVAIGEFNTRNRLNLINNLFDNYKLNELGEVELFNNGSQLLQFNNIG